MRSDGSCAPEDVDPGHTCPDATTVTATDDESPATTATDSRDE